MLPKISKRKKVIYLDNAAATPLDPRVKKATEPFYNGAYGNPSSLHQKGREAKAAIDSSRKTIAQIINAKPSEIIFTAGGTESVNLAIFGVARNYQNTKKRAHLITSVVEHHCVLNSFKALREEGFKTSLINVDGRGVVDLKKLRASIKPESVLVSVMLANNEIGTIEPISEIGKIIKAENLQRAKRGLGRIFFHTDACQAAGFLDLNVERLGVDLMSVNGSKIYGPKQAGFLYVRSGVVLRPIIYGGGQENELRSGTENVTGTAGLARAFVLANKDRIFENKRLTILRDYLINKIEKSISGILLNGPDNRKLKANDLFIRRLPNNINFTVKGVEGESLMLYLDAYGICASTSSACSTGTTEASHVLIAIGRSEAEAKSSIRFSLGKNTTKGELNYLIKIFPQIVKQLRRVYKLD